MKTKAHVIELAVSTLGGKKQEIVFELTEKFWK